MWLSRLLASSNSSRASRGAASRAAACIVGLLALGPGAAQASFPGRNGTIAYAEGTSIGYKETAESISSIRTVDPRSGRVRVLHRCDTRAPLAAPDCGLGAPHYSPDGERLAFSQFHFVNAPGQIPDSRVGLATMAADGTGYGFHPTTSPYELRAWSPSSDRFLVERGPIPEDAALPMLITSLAGDELGRLTPPDAARGRTIPEPDWASTGEVAFVAAPTGCAAPCARDIYLTRLGGAARRLTTRGGESPSWSPDGSRLAFVRRAGSRTDIYLVKRNGRGLRRLTRGLRPTWSPDGRWIAFAREGGHLRGDDIHVIRTDGKRRRLLVRDASSADAVDWQPLPR